MPLIWKSMVETAHSQSFEHFISDTAGATAAVVFLVDRHCFRTGRRLYRLPILWAETRINADKQRALCNAAVALRFHRRERSMTILYTYYVVGVACNHFVLAMVPRTCCTCSAYHVITVYIESSFLLPEWPARAQWHKCYWEGEGGMHICEAFCSWSIHMLPLCFVIRANWFWTVIWAKRRWNAACSCNTCSVCEGSSSKVQKPESSMKFTMNCNMWVKSLSKARNSVTTVTAVKLLKNISDLHSIAASASCLDARVKTFLSRRCHSKGKYSGQFSLKTLV